MKRYLLTLLIIPLIFACVELPEDVNIPQWNTEFNLPLTQKHYLLDELIKTDDYISIDSANGFIYQAHHYDVAEKEGAEDFIEGKLDQQGQDIEIPIADGEGVVGIPFSNGMTLDSARFIRGTMSITVKNTSSSDIDVNMILPAFIASDGSSMSLQTTVAGNSEVDVSEDLDGYRYDATIQDFGPDSLQINGSIAGGDFTGSIIINYSIVNTMFSYLAGIIPPTSLDKIESKTGLPITDDVEDFRDKLQLFDVQLTLLGNYFDKLLPSDPNQPYKLRIDTLYIMGERKDNSESIYLKLNDKADNNLGPIMVVNGELSEVYTNDNSNLSEFLSAIPDSIVVYAVPTINPDKERGAATNKDSIQFGFDLLLKSVVGLKELAVTDTMELEIDSDARESIEDMRAATIYFVIDNKVAFGGDLVMHFADSEFNELFSLDTIKFEAANVDPDGIPSVRHSEPVVELDSTQIQSLAASENIILDVIINTTDSQTGQKVVFSSKDWLDIISFCKIKYHVDLSK
ncbi:hypothetical protein ACFLSQ_00515 [Bacteroidota bacterium]